MAYNFRNCKRTLSEEKNLEHERALRTLKKLKAIEARTPMFHAKIGNMIVGATSEEALADYIKRLQNR